MSTSDGTDFQIPAMGHWRELCALSDVLARELEEDKARGASGPHAVQLPNVWPSLKKLHATGGPAPKVIGASPAHGTSPSGATSGRAKPLPRFDDRIPSDYRWRQLRDRRSTRAVELDLIALMPPRSVAGLPVDVLRSLGAGGAAVADLNTLEERMEALLVDRTWDREVPPGSAEQTTAWNRFEAAVQLRPDFYGHGELDDALAYAAVTRFLERERYLQATHALSPAPKGRSKGVIKEIGQIHSELNSAAVSGGLSSLGIIRVKLLRVIAYRLESRPIEARKELVEATTDLVYNSDSHSEAWLNLLDRVSEEWAWADLESSPVDPGEAAQMAASWLLPQLLRLGHTYPTPYLLEDGDGSSVVHGTGTLRSSVLALLVDRLRLVDGYQSSLAAVLGVARCPLLWERLMHSQAHLAEWRLLARWGQAVFLRAGAESATLPTAEVAARESFIRLSSILSAAHMPPRLSRWDSMALHQQAVGLHHALNPTPQRTSSAYGLIGATRPALPVLKQGDRADTQQKSMTDAALAKALGDIWSADHDETSAHELLKRAGKAAGKSEKTVLSNRPKAAGGCLDYGRAQFLLDLIDAMEKPDRIRASEGIRRFLESLQEFQCPCDEGHDLRLRIRGAGLATPKLEVMIGSSPDQLETFAAVRAATLRAAGDGRWRDELEYAALHAATAGRDQEARLHLAEALNGQGAPSPTEGAETQILVLASLGEANALAEVVDALSGDGGGHHEGKRYWQALARATAFARDAGRDETANMLSQVLERALNNDRVGGDPNLQLEVIGMLALDARPTGRMDRVDRLKDLAADLAPDSSVGKVGLEVMNAVSANAVGDERVEFAALRAAWASCSETSALLWTGLMTSHLIARLIDLEHRLGDPSRAEGILRRLTTRTITKWVDVVPPSEDQVWRQLVAEGRELVAKDEFHPDPDDPDFGADTVPRAAIRPLRMAMADLTLALLGTPKASDRQRLAQFVDTLESKVAAGDRGLPIRVTPRRGCTEEPFGLEHGR